MDADGDVSFTAWWQRGSTLNVFEPRWMRMGNSRNRVDAAVDVVRAAASTELG